jgi:hypothetical protein
MKLKSKCRKHASSVVRRFHASVMRSTMTD